MDCRLSHIFQMADVALWGEAHSKQEQATETCVPACGESFSQWVAFMTGQPESAPYVYPTRVGCMRMLNVAVYN